MRPLFTVTLTILGTVLAGIPLFYLTAETPHQYEQADPTYDEPIKETVSVTVEFSGSPLSCIIRSTSTGAELAAMPEQTKSPWVVPVDNMLTIPRHAVYRGYSGEYVAGCIPG